VSVAEVQATHVELQETQIWMRRMEKEPAFTALRTVSFCGSTLSQKKFFCIMRKLENVIQKKGVSNISEALTLSQ